MPHDYHIAAKMMPLQPKEDGLAHANVYGVPDHVEVIVGETTLNEYGGFVTLTFVEVVESEDTPVEATDDKPKLELVTP
jgi:hypothetical protein